MTKYKINLSDKSIKDMTDMDYKNFIKKKGREKSFNELENIKRNHKKVNTIKFGQSDDGESYLTCDLFNNKQISTLFNLRCKTFFLSEKKLSQAV